MGIASEMAGALAKARREEASINWPTMPSDLNEAYEVQRALVEAMGEPVLGWKVAFTNDAGMQKMKTTEPAVGPLFSTYCTTSGEQLKTAENCMRRVECEYAFKMAIDLPPREAPYTLEEVIAAVATIHPAIEVAHSRLEGAFDVGARALIADHCGNYAFVHGDGVKDWKGLDIINQKVTLFVDGTEQASGSGAEVFGNPVKSLEFLANKLSSLGLGLKAGDIVTTGSCTGMLPVPQECRLVADFGPLGQCTVKCVR